MVTMGVSMSQEVSYNAVTILARKQSAFLVCRLVALIISLVYTRSIAVGPELSQAAAGIPSEVDTQGPTCCILCLC